MMRGMDNEPANLEVATIPPQGLQVAHGADLQMTANTPAGMQESQSAMIVWCERKVASMKQEWSELYGAYEHAVKHKWKADTLKRHAAIAEKRVTFYEKILAALRAGYYIVPSFPITLFAIRTDKKDPKRMYAVLRHERHQDFSQDAKILKPGEGEYKSPNPIVQTDWDERKDAAGNVVGQGYWASDWDDMEFPTNMSKPYIMEATSNAMALKIFDEIGVLPQDFKRNPDPIIAGRIIDPRPPGYGEQRKVTFLICWHLDTSTL